MDTLTVLAIVPGLVLLFMVYRFDKKEKESKSNILKYLIFGVFATFAAALIEAVGCLVLESTMENNVLRNALEYFVVVAGAEEGIKYYVFMKCVWNNNREFNYKFDGIVYAVSIGMGFAIYENIRYVKRFGMTTGIARAFTAVPAHAVFAIIMGCFFGLARKEAGYSSGYGKTNETLYRKLALIVPMFVHGLYDFLAVSESKICEGLFLALIFLMYWVGYIILNRTSESDERVGY